MTDKYFVTCDTSQKEVIIGGLFASLDEAKECVGGNADKLFANKDVTSLTIYKFPEVGSLVYRFQEKDIPGNNKTPADIPIHSLIQELVEKQRETQATGLFNILTETREQLAAEDIAKKVLPHISEHYSTF